MARGQRAARRRGPSTISAARATTTSRGSARCTTPAGPASHWPKEYGGRGASLMEQLIWYEEYARAGAPEPLDAVRRPEPRRPDADRLRQRGAEGLPPAADPARRRRLVPGLLRARRRLRSRRACRRAPSSTATTSSSPARRSGPASPRSPSSRSCWCAPIPDAPKHKGITWVICPMDAARAWRSARSRRSPATATSARSSTTRCASRSRNVVGKLNDGWRVAMATLSFERGTAFLSEQVRLARRVDELIAQLARAAARAATAGTRRSTTTRSRAGWRSPRAEVEALRAMTYRSVSRAARTGMPGAEASLIRLFFSELLQRIDALAMDILGAGGPRAASSADGSADRRVAGALPRRPVADDRRRHEGHPAQHHRRARARPAALRTDSDDGPDPRTPSRRRSATPSAACSPTGCRMTRVRALIDRSRRRRRGALARGGRARLVRPRASRRRRRRGLRPARGDAAVRGARARARARAVARHRARGAGARAAPATRCAATSSPGDCASRVVDDPDGRRSGAARGSRRARRGRRRRPRRRSSSSGAARRSLRRRRATASGSRSRRASTRPAASATSRFARHAPREVARRGRRGACARGRRPCSRPPRRSASPSARSRCRSSTPRCASSSASRSARSRRSSTAAPTWRCAPRWRARA